MLQILKKHVKNFTDPKRDVTSYVHFIDDGSVVVTDAHKLVKVLDVHTEAAHMRKTDCKTVVTTPLEKPVKDFNRLFPNDTPRHEIELNIKETLANIAAVASVLKLSEDDNNTARLSCDTQDVYLSANVPTEGAKAKVHICEGNLNGLVISFNIEYFIQCLILLKDFKYETVTLALHGPLKPMVFLTIDESVEMILLPVRT